MNYKLTEEYFETAIFQSAVQEYFDTVIKGLLNFKEIITAKGWFIDEKGKLIKADLYDMPYHIHILNGLIPALFVYEQFCIKKELIKDADIEKYLKTFILGFTFHDANKLTGVNWNNALRKIDSIIEKFNVLDFFPEFQTFKSDVYFLALSTEDGTEVLKNQYKVSLNFHHLTEILEPLCNFADGLASIKELDGVESFYKEAEKKLSKINQIVDLKLSYIKIHENPYTLLSQDLLNTAGKVLKQNGRSILYTMRDGILFFGDDLKVNEKEMVFREFESADEDIDILKLTKIDAQKCNFGFLGSVKLTKQLLDKIIENLSDKFLLLSPNGSEKIEYFDDFINFNEKLIESAELPINIILKDDKLYLNFSENAIDDYPVFVKIFCLQKIMWLNGKLNKVWENDFQDCIDSEDEIPFKIEQEFRISENNFKSISKISDLKLYFSSITKTSNTNLKTYIAIIKTIIAINSFEDEQEQDGFIDDLYSQIIKTFANDKENESSVLSELCQKYFTFKGNIDFSFILDFTPNIPNKKEMCAFTGGNGMIGYKEVNSYAMKATGFNNRTWAALKNSNNPVNYISKLFDEENKKRKGVFNIGKIGTTDSVLSIYYDFFETALDIDKDIYRTISVSRNLNLIDNLNVELYKNAKFDYTSNVQFYKNQGKSLMLNIFYFVRKQILIIKKLNIRVYITGIMSPYHSHKEVFVYENAPRFVKDLGWNKVRLCNIEMVLDEISLLMELGKSRKSINSGLVLNYAESPNSIFRAFYEFSMRKNDQEVNNAKNKLKEFINKYPLKFKNMTTIEKLVDIALQIQSSAKSGSEETWLIRTALDFIRKDVKEKLGKEDTIQQIAGNIYKTQRLEYANIKVIENFAKAVYEDLYENQWKRKLPTINRQKDWIYQFGFVYKMRVDELISEKSDEKVIKKLKDKKQEISRENILKALSEKQKYFADIIVERILNRVNNQ